MASAILTKELAEQAMLAVAPAVVGLSTRKVTKRTDLHIVICNPSVRSSDLPMCSFDAFTQKAILYEQSFNSKSGWQFPFDHYARTKAFQTWQYGLTTSAIVRRAPFLLEKNHTIYGGSYSSDGLVVAVSGVQDYFDEMIACWIHAACRALCIHALASNEQMLIADGFVK